MATTVETKPSAAKIRVALIIESGRLKPVWFEETDRKARDRVFIKKVCYNWSHREGSAKIINFAVTDGDNSYTLSLNTQEFTWSLGITESSSYPY